MRKLIYGVKNLIRWFPTIWKDRDYDHYYIMEILKKKLEFQAESTRKYSLHKNSEKYAKQMERCAALIHIVQNEVFINDLIDNDDDVSAEKFREAIDSHSSAKHDLFNIMEENIESWWH